VDLNGLHGLPPYVEDPEVMRLAAQFAENVNRYGEEVRGSLLSCIHGAIVALTLQEAAVKHLSITDLPAEQLAREWAQRAGVALPKEDWGE
jgi:hypothetical protein